MKQRLTYILTAFLFSVQIVSAQYYNTGQDPASLKWKQIKTGRFTVIYPEKYGAEGIAYAKSLNEAYSKLGSLLPEKKFKIPVIIHNYTIQSNGYVSWAPKRIELYPTPEQNTYPLSPVKQLTYHELTHVLQIESLNHGFSKGMSYLLGEQSIGVVTSLLPVWLLEGDAVFAESVLTQSGRGRTPAFQKPLKAMIVDNRNPYSYDKILNGSYRDYVPDYYQSGFQMAALAMAKYDLHIWNKVFDYTAEEPFILNPVNTSLRNYGTRKKLLWRETYDTLRTIWTKQVSGIKPSGFRIANPEKQGKYINYYSPVYAGKDSIYAVRTSLSLPTSIVLIDPAGRTEKRIRVPGQLYPWFVSYAKGKLVWVETEPDPRWENREYSVIKLMDLQNRTVTKLSRKTRYLSAAISPDGSKIVAVENTINNINSLIVLNATSGAITQSVNTQGNVYLQHPQWSSDNRIVTFIFLDDAGEGIISFNSENQKWQILLEAGRNDLQSSFQRNDSLFFISSSSGTDNIYLRTPDNKISALTSSRFGTTDLSPYGNRILFGDYTYSGNDICSSTISPVTAEDKNSTSFLINRFDIKTANSTDTSALYIPEPYKKWKHLFRFHSWMPFYADIEELKAYPASVRPGITIMTQNSLSTLTSTLSYEYSADHRNLFHSRITWKGWYPVIESQLDYGFVPHIAKMMENVANPANLKSGISFLNTISFPLNFSTGRFSQYLRPSISTDYINEYIYIKDKGTYDYGQTIINGRLYFSNYHQSAYRDIYPRWAQVLDFNYCFAPLDKQIYGKIRSLKTSFYFPGLFPNHGIRIRLEAEKQDPKKYLYSNFTSIPRGYDNLISKEIQFLSFDYVMPLAYPDFNIASLLYLKRIRTGLFYDYATGPGNAFFDLTSKGAVPLSNSPEFVSFKSFGFELLTDFHILRIPYMISGGIQSAWKNINDKPSIQWLFNIDLFGMSLGRKKM